MVNGKLDQVGSGGMLRGLVEGLKLKHLKSIGH